MNEASSLLHFNPCTGRFENGEIAVDAQILDRLRLDRYRALLARDDPDYLHAYYEADAYARRSEHWHIGMEGVHVPERTVESYAG